VINDYTGTLSVFVLSQDLTPTLGVGCKLHVLAEILLLAVWQLGLYQEGNAGSVTSLDFTPASFPLLSLRVNSYQISNI
jgi:hypothetical protein